MYSTKEAYAAVWHLKDKTGIDWEYKIHGMPPSSTLDDIVEEAYELADGE